MLEGAGNFAIGYFERKLAAMKIAEGALKGGAGLRPGKPRRG